MLTRLRITGFKNLLDVDIRFGPFTCVAGPNGIGKSNLFDAIRFLSLLANHTVLDAALKIRSEVGSPGDVRHLFHTLGGTTRPVMSFDVEMIVPGEATDDLGQQATASTTFLRYRLDLRLRDPAVQGPIPDPIEVLREELTHIKKGDAHHHVLFPHRKDTWRDSVVVGRRAGTEFISTEVRDGAASLIKLHQDGRAGRPYGREANRLPRTVLSSANASESPTALCARREMESWQLLQLEPASLRQPDPYSAPPRLSNDGRHLAANLNRLVSKDPSGRIPAQIANRLNELIGGVRSVRVDDDKKREILSVMLTDQHGTEFPARSLSDGTLRFMALSVLELDADTARVFCLEEPENGIHPSRLGAMLQLLQDMAVDPELPVDDSNPLRQVIINTHSPNVVALVPADSLLLARPRHGDRLGETDSGVEFAWISGTWRKNASQGDAPTISPGHMLPYLGATRGDGIDVPTGKGDAARGRRRRQVMEHPEFAVLFHRDPPPQ